MVPPVASHTTSAVQSLGAGSAESRRNAMIDKHPSGTETKRDFLELSTVANRKDQGTDVATLTKKVDATTHSLISETDASLIVKKVAAGSNPGADFRDLLPSGDRAAGREHITTTAAGPANTREIFVKLDANKDGSVSLTELNSGSAKESVGTTAAETNESGSATENTTDSLLHQSELEAYITRTEDALKSQAQAASGASVVVLPTGPASAANTAPVALIGGSGSGVPAIGAGAATSKMNNGLDTNRDGEVSFDEQTAGLAKESGAPSPAQSKAVFPQVELNAAKEIEKNEFDAFKSKIEENQKSQIQNAAIYHQQHQINYDVLGNTVNTTV